MFNEKHMLLNTLHRICSTEVPAGKCTFHYLLGKCILALKKCIVLFWFTGTEL